MSLLENLKASRAELGGEAGRRRKYYYAAGKEYEGVPLTRSTELDYEFYEKYQQQQRHFEEEGYNRNNIESFRRKLPSFQRQEAILEMIRSNQVSLISGETGCGKTTQVAQFILDDYIRRECGSTCHVICTQPRRISAISVAERVADERGERVGTSVGYQIRLEHKKPRDQGSILFCTLGVLLRFMINDARITRASHIIIDEIHERDTLSDFLLIVIKDLLSIRTDLKVVLMSATLNADTFSRYFDNCPFLQIPGSAFEVQDHYLEDFIGKLAYTPSEETRRKPRGNKREYWHQQEEYFEYLESIKSQYPPVVTSRLEQINFDRIDNDLIMSVLHYINNISGDGAVLVFLPGWQDISNLHKSLTESPLFGNPTRFLIIPLHSRLPTVSQREVFDRPPDGCRKIVIATNIAETSITIDDVVFVIDCGKAREMGFNVELNLSSLDLSWISKASEKQRRGRAGRVQNGHCFHLFTKFHHSTFLEFQLPEMLRTPLDSLCLQVKILKLGKMWEFLSKAIEPPQREMCKKAVEELKQMRALDDNEDLTSLGYYLAILPVSPKIGRMILFGAMFSCLDPVLTVAASLDSKDPFFAPLGKEKEADRKKWELSEGSKSDHIALVNAFYKWSMSKDSGRFCYENFLSASNLRFIDGMKNQFLDLLHNIGFINMKEIDNKGKRLDKHNINSGNYNLVKAVICAGLYPNVAKLEYNIRGTRVRAIYTFGHGGSENLKVGIHPKSVNGDEQDYQSQWLIFHQKMKIENKVYLFDTTMCSPYPLLFFGGKIRFHEDGGQDTIEVDDGIKFHSSLRTANLVIDLREELDKLLGKKIDDPKMKLVVGEMNNRNDEHLLTVIIDLITSEQVVAKRDFDS